MISFDNFPAVYWLAGYVLAGFVILCGLSNRVPIRIFLALCTGLITFMRLPVIVLNRELNPDESQMLSHGITLYQDPVYWQSVDGTTIGPLDNYLLVLPRIFGFQIDYTSGRTMGLLCALGTLILLFYSMKNWFGSTPARSILLIPTLFLAFTQETDFVHYSSEQFPVLLLALSLFLLTRISGMQGSLSMNAYALGFVSGAIPFAKLQAVPQALVLVFTAMWICYQLYRKQKDGRPLMLLVAGGLTFPILLFTWAAGYQVLADVVDFYLLGNVIYAGGSHFFSIPAQFFKIFGKSPDFIAFTSILIIPVLVAFVRWITSSRWNKGSKTRTIAIIILLLAGSSIYAVTKSGNDFVHYLNFCIVPWTLLGACATTVKSRFTIVLPVLMLAWFGANDAYHFMQERTINSMVSVNATALGESKVVKELKKYTRTGDYMVVWGWQCIYYVEAQLAQGTAENHSERSIFEHPMLEKYRSRYLSDIKKTRPAVFLDAVGKNSYWVQNKKLQGLASYPELAAYINEHYRYYGSFDDTRLYVRKDRLR